MTIERRRGARPSRGNCVHGARGVHGEGKGKHPKPTGQEKARGPLVGLGISDVRTTRAQRAPSQPASFALDGKEQMKKQKTQHHGRSLGPIGPQWLPQSGPPHTLVVTDARCPRILPSHIFFGVAVGHMSAGPLGHTPHAPRTTLSLPAMVAASFLRTFDLSLGRSAGSD